MYKIGIGIMSGTSLDGIDIAIIKIKGVNESTIFEFIYGKTVEYEAETLKVLTDVLRDKIVNIEILTSLHYQLGKIYASAVLEAIAEAGISISSIDYVASHGQTIWHNPFPKNNLTSSTLQIGEGAIISNILKTTVVSNFRAADIAASGQGAPLVSFVDKLLFKQVNKIVSLHNLGGISNLTLLGNDIEFAYDTGPANIMINHAMKVLYNQDYDEDGKVAQSGTLISEIYDEVMSLDFFRKPYPKSTGRELFSEQLVEELISKYPGYAKEDYIHTFTKITIISIVNEYQKFDFNIDEIIFSGGGVHNKYVINSIKEALPNICISDVEKYGMNIDFKEAIAFAILGNQTLNKQPSNLISATGAIKKMILGQVNYYYKGE